MFLLAIDFQIMTEVSVLTSVMVAKTIPEATLADLLRGILSNQQALAEACGVALPYVMDNRELDRLNNITIDDGAKGSGIVLPYALRKAMLHARAFDEAVAKGYIQMTDDGHLEWMLGNATLLAYFLGRLFSGDCSKYSKAKCGMLWVKGKKTFPATELQLLFGEKTLRKLRQQREGRSLPVNFELIDKLFL